MAEALGCLPLGLTHAAALIRDSAMTYHSYLQQFADTTLDEQLPHYPGDPYPVSTVKAILLNVHPVERQLPHARTLLDILAFLFPDGVHRSLVAAILPSQVDVDTVMVALFRACLITYAGADGQVLLMHRMVQRALRGRAIREGRVASTVRDMAADLDRQFVSAEEGWAHRERGDEIANHVMALWINSESCITQEDQKNILLVLSRYVYHLTISVTSTAVTYAEALDNSTRRVLGDDHPNTLTATNNLAYAYRAAGRSAEAAALARGPEKDNLRRQDGSA